MSSSFGLTVQRLPSSPSRVLVMLHLAIGRSTDGWVDADDIREAFLDLRVPVPPQLARDLTRLVAAHLVLRTAKGVTLTPEGVEKVRSLIGQIDVAELEPQLASYSGALLGHGLHTLIPWTLAPVKWRPAIARLLKTHPFERNVFLMTRFPREDYPTDPIAGVIEGVRAVVEKHGLALHVASDRLIDDDLLANVAGYMWACKFGIALFEDRVEEGLNENLVIEVGAMLMTGRRCALLRDKTAPPMPTDLVGQIYRPVDFSKMSTVSSEVNSWIKNDLSTDLGNAHA